MHKLRKYFIQMMVFVLGVLSLAIMTGIVEAYADVVYINEDNGYEVIIEDDAGLLSWEEKIKLQEDMEKITEWGNVAFITIDDNIYVETKYYAEAYYNDTFDGSSATVFLIDMDKRNIWIYSGGKIYKTITKSYADTITDNVYRYATDGKYYECSSEAFKQIYTLLSGHRIAQPMKYISNAFLAVILALIINYFIVRKFSSPQKAKRQELLRSMIHHCTVNEPNADFKYQTRKYDPPSSSSHGSGHSGGGGGHRGGGGGHSF